jgi:hypothetical protein
MTAEPATSPEQEAEGSQVAETSWATSLQEDPPISTIPRALDYTVITADRLALKALLLLVIVLVVALVLAVPIMEIVGHKDAVNGLR